MKKNGAGLILEKPLDKRWEIGSGRTINVALKWNESFADKFTDIFLRGQTVLDQLVIDNLEEYMPFDTGEMIDSMKKASVPGTGTIVVNTAYAKEVYYGRAIQGKNGALRGPYYFERMLADKKEYLLQAVATEMGGKI